MKRFSLYSLIVLLAFNNSLLWATPWVPVEVQHVYKAAQRGDAALVEKNLEWHREHDKKKPVTMLEQARDMAVAHNDAKAAVFLTTRLKQEQMGSWEKYFRGITLVATLGAITGAFIGVNAVFRGRLAAANTLGNSTNRDSQAHASTEEVQEVYQAVPTPGMPADDPSVPKIDLGGAVDVFEPGMYHQQGLPSAQRSEPQSKELSHEEALDKMFRRTPSPQLTPEQDAKTTADTWRSSIDRDSADSE